jgi:anthranilate synthase component 1/para-aminobenzoate synthetase
MDPHIVATVVAAIEAIPRVPSRPVIVAIDGPSGSGKSHLSARLSEHIAATVISMDEIYPGWDGLRPALDTLANQVLSPLRRGQAAVFATWDWTNGCPGPPREVNPDSDAVIIIDGVGSGCQAAREHLDLLIWLFAEESTRRHRALARKDWQESEKWDIWSKQESRYFSDDDPQGHADMHVRTDGAMPPPL